MLDKSGSRGTILKICIVIPTYNERGNVRPLVTQVEKLLSECDFEGYLFFVDDASPDGTGEIAEELANEYENIFVHHRQGKLGLGSAYREAFEIVLTKMEVDYIFEMDADLSHDPKYITRFIQKLAEGYDVVVGSRYVKGGGVEGWPFRRRLISKGANYMARLITGVDVKDMTSGYRAYRVDALRSIDFQSLTSEGYAFQVEILFKCAEASLKIGESPFIFKERSAGESKLGKGSILEFLKILINILLRRLAQLVSWEGH